MRRALALAMTLAATPLHADDAAVLAQYWANSGSLPPEYAWSTVVTLLDDGAVTMKHCKGYVTEGPDCHTASAQTTPEARTAILIAARDSGLMERPAERLQDVPVGGGQTGGAVFLDGVKLDLPPFPTPTDTARVTAVLLAITDAIAVAGVTPPSSD